MNASRIRRLRTGDSEEVDLLRRRGRVFRQSVQREIELQHIHPWVSKDVECAILNIARDELPQIAFLHVPRGSNPRRLRMGGLRRNMRVKAASGGGHHVDRDMALSEFGACGLGALRDLGDQAGAGRSGVRAAGGERVRPIVRTSSSARRNSFSIAPPKPALVV
jgi:hypothetical protein